MRTNCLVSFSLCCATRVKHSRFASWAPAWCRLTDDSKLALFSLPPTPGDSNPPSGRPTKTVPLVGSHLAASGAPDEFTIRGGEGATLWVRCPSPRDRDGWMAALGKVPGLFRRVEDFYVLGRRWGHGATSEVHECTSRFTGRQLALKSRLHSTREATEAMHNELRILQLCAKHP